MNSTLLAVLTASSLAAAASAQVIAVDATHNCGASDPDGPTLTLAPGLYNAFPVDGAFNPWGYTAGCNAGADCSEGWIWCFYASINQGRAILLPERPVGRWATPGLALDHAPVASFRVEGPGPQTVKFFIFDDPCSDNLGTVTFEIRPACPADFTGDGFVDFFDYDDFVACFETGACPPGRSADFNGDGFADFFDYDDFVSAFDAGC